MAHFGRAARVALLLTKAQAPAAAYAFNAGSRAFASAAESGGGSGLGKIIFGIAAAGAGAYAADQAGLINIFGSGAPGSSSLPSLSLETKKDYTAVRKAIEDILDVENYDDGSYGPLFVRLAWHSAGTYDKASGTGGSDGALMRFPPESEWGANAGLALAREALEPIKKKFPWITYGDLWTLAGVVAVESMGGPNVPWHPGRTDKDVNSPALPDGRLPDASQGAAHIRDVFYRMGFDDREIVALSGAHTLGRCHRDRSGFEGPWTNAPTTFSNLYFQELKNNKWRKKRWNGPLQYEDKSGQLMMLPTDMALLWDKKFKPFVDLYAKEEETFFKDFAAAFSKLLELGCHNLQAQTA